LKLKKGRVATDLRQHFFTERVINTWNRQDAAVIEAGTINTFKSRLQKLHDKGANFSTTHTFPETRAMGLSDGVHFTILLSLC